MTRKHLDVQVIQRILGVGEVASSIRSVNPAGLWITMMAMLLGRLEICTLLILFTVTFWRK